MRLWCKNIVLIPFLWNTFYYVHRGQSKTFLSALRLSVSVCRLYRVVVPVAEWWHKMLPWQHLLLQQRHPLLWLHLVSFDWLECVVFSRPGVSESFEVDG